MPSTRYDAVVVGAGPNGLAAAIALALKGLSVVIFEEKEAIGGGTRSMELTKPGFMHDVCSAIHPLAYGSPFFRRLPLSQYGLEWIQPTAPLAHPFDDGSCLLLERSLEETCNNLGADGEIYGKLVAPFVENWSKLEDLLLGPLSVPQHPLLALRFGLKAIKSCTSLADNYFTGERTKGFFAGLAAHSILPLERTATAAVALVLGILGHVYGWPMPRGGSQSIADALGRYYQALGGEIQTGVKITSLEQLPDSRIVLFDLTPRQILEIAGSSLSHCYKRQLSKFRYGPGVFKMDWALAGPIPWRAPACSKAGTVHLGGTLGEIAASERASWKRHCPEKPYVLLAQNSLFDDTRAPAGKHTAWAYCHVPHGSTEDMSMRIEAQIERFAPGFQRQIIARSCKNTSEMNAFNSNYIGGDIIGGVQDIWQLFTRPVNKIVPYATSNSRLYICSSSTPPGGGVHGMCGYHAARVAMQREFKIKLDWKGVENAVAEAS